VSGLIESRRDSSTRRLHQLERELDTAEALARGKACACVIGSFGRGEASAHSDVDPVIVGGTAGDRRLLSNLGHVCIAADLIRASRRLGFPDFSGDGEYLKHHTARDLVQHLGTEQDDVTNALTIRLLLLLESRPIFGAGIYSAAIHEILSAYWREYAAHDADFIPAFLTNDILRLWRTFCVNYEARTSGEPPEKKAKRKLKNYKLKHSRLLTCYSGLAFLLATFVERGTVTLEDAKRMVGITPTERLQDIAGKERFAACRAAVDRLIERYEKFLEITDAPEGDLIARFIDPAESAQLTAGINGFGDLIWELLKVIGDGNRMLRMLIV
jgi:hypothetical protein